MHEHDFQDMLKQGMMNSKSIMLHNCLIISVKYHCEVGGKELF